MESREIIGRLRKKKLAMVAMGIITLSIIVSIFGYWLTPDSSPNANRMILEISGQRPGFHMNFLKISKTEVKQVSLWHKTLEGQPDKYTWIPITDYKVTTDSIFVQRFVDEGITERMGVSLAQLLRSPEDKIDDHLSNHTFWLGTDKFGRDILSRLILGTRVSLSVGGLAMLISLTFGILLGLFAGYYRGWVDEMIMWFTNVTWSIPTLLLVFAITMTLGKGFWQVFLAVGLTLWVSVARLIRGQVFAVREMEYIEAARALGYSHTRILFRHILPNIMGPVWVIGAANFASAIVIEAGLSFLGVGVQPPQPSWGLMIKENYNFIITNNPMLAIVPGLAIMLLVLSFNLLGNALRDIMDVKG